jgi:inner membrane protein
MSKAISLSDSRGIRNNPILTLNRSKPEFKPGNIAPLSGNGIHADINTFDISQEHLIEFSFPVELQGMTKLAVMYRLSDQ